jgi:hypothetical protein
MLFQKNDSLSEMGLRYRQWIRRLKFSNFPLAYQSNFYNGIRDMTIERKKIDSKSNYVGEALPRSRGHMLFGTDSAFSQPKQIKSNATFTLYPFNRLYLERIFQLTRTSGSQVIMVIPPWNDTSLVSPGNTQYLAQAHRILGEFVSPYPHVRLVTRPVTLPNNCFGDASFHLNERGVDRYTEELRRHVFLPAEATQDLPEGSTPDL